jgi:hypothetical protein
MNRTLLISILLMPTPLLAQGFDIYLFDISRDYTLVQQVTDREGYDNQPAFTRDSQSLMFSSDRAGEQTDLFRYSVADGELTNLTNSPDENEFSPQPYGEDRFSYVLQEGNPYQHVWHRAFDGGDPQRLLTSYVPVGYYTRNGKGVLFWGRYTYSLFFEPAGAEVGPGAGESLYVIDQAGRSIHAIPNGDHFSFVHKQSDWSWVIKRFDPDSKAMTPLVRISPDNEDYCWHPDEFMITADGKKLVKFEPGEDESWQDLAELQAPGLNEGGRCAVSADGRYLALVNLRP